MGRRRSKRIKYVDTGSSKEKYVKQCPVCGMNGLHIEIKKHLDKKHAKITCEKCGFSYEFDNLPLYADKFLVYAKLVDLVSGVIKHDEEEHFIEDEGSSDD